MSREWSRRGIVVLLAAGAAVFPARGRAQAAFGADDFRLLPLRVHLLRSRETPELNCKLQESDARRIVPKVNGVWRQAGLQFYVDQILGEYAANQALYRGLGANRTEAHLLLVRPPASRTDQTFHVYYIGGMRPNGICLSASYQLLFVKENPRLYRVADGLDENLPRVTAHEIGHALGLLHREETFNLMASGTTGARLNEAEVSTSRRTAENYPFCLTAPAALQRAERLPPDKKDEARELYTALTGLPGGEIAKAARERLAGL